MAEYRSFIEVQSTYARRC